MTGILAIGANERVAVAAALTMAHANIRPWSVMKDVALGSDTTSLSLAERAELPNPEALAGILRRYPSQNVELGTYRCAVSLEEQPAGVMKHLSVSSRMPGKVPNEHVMRMVCEVFGFSDFPPLRPYRVWVEEFEPGHHAINIVELEP